MAAPQHADAPAGLSGTAPTSVEEALASAPPEGLTVRPAAPALFSEQLESGLTLIHRPWDGLPTAHVLLQIRSGTRDDAATPGVALLSGEVLSQALRDDASPLQPTLSVSRDAIRLGFDVLPQGLGSALERIARALDAPPPSALALDQLKRDAAESVDDLARQDPAWISEQYAYQALFAHSTLSHPYAAPPPSPDQLLQRTVADCDAWRRRHVVSGNLDLIVIGGPAHDALIAMLGQTLGEKKRWMAPPPERPEAHRAKGPERLEIVLQDRPDLSHVLTTLAFLTAPPKSAAWPETTLLRDVLAGRSGRLPQLLERDLQLASAASAELIPLALNLSVLELSATSSIESAPEVAESLLIESERRSREPIDEEAMQRARGVHRGRWLGLLDSPTQSARFFADHALYQTPPLDALEASFSAVENLDADGLLSAVSPYLDRRHAVMVVVGPAVSLQEPLSGLAPVKVFSPDKPFQVPRNLPHDPSRKRITSR